MITQSFRTWNVQTEIKTSGQLVSCPTNAHGSSACRISVTHPQSIRFQTITLKYHLGHWAIGGTSLESPIGPFVFLAYAPSLLFFARGASILFAEPRLHSWHGTLGHRRLDRRCRFHLGGPGREGGVLMYELLHLSTIAWTLVK